MSNEELLKTVCDAVQAEPEFSWNLYQLTKDFLPTVATVIVALISVRFAVLHIKQQHQNSLDLQAKERKKEIQLKLFEEIQARLDNCSSLAERLSTDMIFKSTFISHGVSQNHDENEFSARIREVLQSITDVTIYIEHREAISPKLFRVARSALHSAHHDLMAIVKDTQSPLNIRYDACSKAAGNASSYCHDLNVCLQNETFDGLFEGKAPVRKSIDPDEKVIINDEKTLDELLQYFEHESPYGQYLDQIKSDTSKQYGAG